MEPLGGYWIYSEIGNNLYFFPIAGVHHRALDQTSVTDCIVFLILIISEAISPLATVEMTKQSQGS